MISPSSKLFTGDSRTINVKDVTETYRSIANISTPTHGRIQRVDKYNTDIFSLTSYFKTTDCDSSEYVKTLKVYTLQTRRDRVETIRCVSEMHRVSELASAVSLDGRRLARLTSSSGGKQELLEIWEHNRLIKTLDITELEVHGRINTDAAFSSFVWSPDGDKLLYVTQPKRPKYFSFFKDKDGEGWGTEYVKKEDWGECLAGAEHTIVGILDVANDCQITLIDVEGYSLGTPMWLDNGKKIVSVAFNENPRKLGLHFCTNRPSKIVVHDWKSSNHSLLFEIGSDTDCFHSVRVDNGGTRFLYLKNSVYGPHRPPSTMNIYDIRERKSETLVDKSTGKSKMFISDLPKSCFTSNDRHILFVEEDYISHQMSIFSIEESEITRIKFPTTGLSVLDFRYDVILASGSEINTTPTLFVAKFNISNVKDVVLWHQIEDCIHYDDIYYRSFKIPTPDGSSFVSAILTAPHWRSSLGHHDLYPTVIRIHGGPHSAYTLSYNPSTVFYTKLGLQTLMINYRGSTGVDEDYLKSLCGRIGELDVEDCMFTIRHLVESGSIDAKKIVLEGGSHGGFLACHLSCQEEFKFSCALIRNPVVDLSFNYMISDIPDWCLTESLGHTSFNHSANITEAELMKMFARSPISKVEKANVPTLMLLGSKDLRVPMAQGERWVDKLKARGVETLCKIYPDGHALDKADVSADCSITSAIWILNHVNERQRERLGLIVVE